MYSITVLTIIPVFRVVTQDSSWIMFLKNMESAGAMAPGSPSISEKLRNDQKPVFHFMKDGDIFDLGDKKLVVYEMTGHTSGTDLRSCQRS